MKFRVTSPVLLLLLPAITTALADQSTNYEKGKDFAAVERDTYGTNAIVPDVDEISPRNSKGTQDAPVDGRDGRPHAGPWVETNAERDRKKFGTTEKPRQDVKSTDRLNSKEEPIPYSNNAKEGTRGTEGGVSGKSRDSSYTGDKSPDSPKEALPLPYSEERKHPSTGEESSAKDTKGSSTDSTLGKFEV